MSEESTQEALKNTSWAIERISRGLHSRAHGCWVQPRHQMAFPRSSYTVSELSLEGYAKASLHYARAYVRRHPSKL
jgi:hypothetical protein